MLLLNISHPHLCRNAVGCLQKIMHVYTPLGLLFNQLLITLEHPRKDVAVLLGWIKLSEAWKERGKACIGERAVCYASACGCMEIELNTPCSLLVVSSRNNTFVCTHTHTLSHFEKCIHIYIYMHTQFWITLRWRLPF